MLHTTTFAIQNIFGYVMILPYERAYTGQDLQVFIMKLN